MHAWRPTEVDCFKNKAPIASLLSRILMTNGLIKLQKVIDHP